MKNLYKTLILGSIILLIILSMYFMNPSKAEVERYLKKNNCIYKDYCVYNMRRNTAMLWGQIFKIPVWWVFPNFILYTTTPFHYYHDLKLEENIDDYWTYTWVDTRDGRFVYNAVTGEYIKEIDDKEDPWKKWNDDIDEMAKKIRDLQENAECSYNAYDCDDFDTHREAQAVYYTCGGISNDVHWLDGDNDGIACEDLK